jgi:hypothetical protein
MPHSTCTHKNNGIIIGDDIITHVQEIMVNGVIILPTHEVANPSCWYLGVQKFTQPTAI